MTKTKNKKREAPIWSATSNDAAQLFRDIYFGKYPPDSKASIAHKDLTRNFRLYNGNSFTTHFKKFQERVRCFREFGTGIDNEEFRKKLKLHILPPPEERAPTFQPVRFLQDIHEAEIRAPRRHHSEVVKDDNNDDDNDDETIDETYMDSRKDDISLDGFEIESFLGFQINDNGNNNGNDNYNKNINKTTNENVYDNTHENEKENVFEYEDNNMARSTESTTAEAVGIKKIVRLPGGVWTGYIKHEPGFKGHFYIGEDARSIWKKSYIHPEFLHATNLYGRIGLDRGNVSVAHLQQTTDEELRDTKKDQGGYYHEEKLFALSKEVHKDFYDENGAKTSKLKHKMGVDDVSWLVFWVREREPEVGFSPEATIDFERRRRTNHAAEDNANVAPAPFQFGNTGGNFVQQPTFQQPFQQPPQQYQQPLPQYQQPPPQYQQPPLQYQQPPLQYQQPSPVLQQQHPQAYQQMHQPVNLFPSTANNMGAFHQTTGGAPMATAAGTPHQAAVSGGVLAADSNNASTGRSASVMSTRNTRPRIDQTVAVAPTNGSFMDAEDGLDV